MESLKNRLFIFLKKNISFCSTFILILMYLILSFINSSSLPTTLYTGHSGLNIYCKIFSHFYVPNTFMFALAFIFMFLIYIYIIIYFIYFILNLYIIFNKKLYANLERNILYKAFIKIINITLIINIFTAIYEIYICNSSHYGLWSFIDGFIFFYLINFVFFIPLIIIYILFYLLHKLLYFVSKLKKGV